jgi:hypothetical protein
MTKCRCDDLRKGGTQGASVIRRPVRLYLQLIMTRTDNMAEFMNDGALLCHRQQQQEP